MSEHEEVATAPVKSKPKPAPKRKPAPKKPSTSEETIARREADAKDHAKRVADKYAPPAEDAPAAEEAPPAKSKPKVKTPKKVVADDGSIGDNAKKQLTKLKEKILNLEDEKAEIAAEVKEIYATAKSMGFDTKILRKVVAASKRDPSEVDSERAMFDLYADAVGLYSNLEG